MSSIHQQIRDKEKEWENAYRQGVSASSILQSRSQFMDQQVIETAEKAAQKDIVDKICVVALGGYGRLELNVHSDIDLMILHDDLPESILEEFNSALCYPLWDSGLQVQVTARTLQDCLAVIRRDFSSQSSLLEIRLVWGNKIFFAKLKDCLKKFWRSKKNQRRFVQGKYLERKGRLSKYGDSVYILEPHIKEGKGGLRDYHYFRWLALLLGFSWEELLSPEERAKLKESLNFLWSLRDWIHYQEGRRQDRFTFSLQESLASVFHFKDSPQTSGAQQFIQRYYQAATFLQEVSIRAVHRLVEAHWISLGKRVKRFLGPAIQYRCDTPLAGLQKMLEVKNRGIPIPARVSSELATLAERIDGNSWEDGKAASLWKKLFQNPKGLSKVLFAMQDMGWLPRWFPEMLPILHFAPRDAYHVYTVDIHTLKAIENIDLLAREKKKNEFVRVYRLLEKPELLLWAIFFHDLGKGAGAKDHSEESLRIAKTVLERLKFSREEEEHILFLIRSHLTMPRLAFLRDFTDLRLIGHFAEEVRDISNLQYLYLLSYADIKAVGPGVLSFWKRRLLTELYQAVSRHLKEEDIFPKKKRERLNVEQEYSHRYRLRRPLFLMYQDPSLDKTHSELLIVTQDAPGLFAKLAGVLSSVGFDILQADIQTTQDGIAMDWFSIQEIDGKPPANSPRWAILEKNLEMILLGEEEVEHLLKKKKPSPWTQKEGPSLPATQVFLDTDISAFSTVLEVHTTDRHGLLYDLTRIFHTFFLNINHAKISTEGGRVVDVFYLSDSQGRKILDKVFWEEVSQKIIQNLEEEGE